MRHERAPADASVADIAARQHGIVAHRQLRAVGLSPSAIARRVQAGRLHPVHRGVYAVGYSTLTYERRWMAAALACGDGALISHRSAAMVWGLLKAEAGIIDVSVRGHGGNRQRTGIRLHRSRSLTPAMRTRRHNIPVTTPARTVADLRRIGTAQEVRRAIRQADALGLSIQGPNGIDATDQAETVRNAVKRTRSELEWMFFELCREHLLPLPEINVRIGNLEVDFLWRAQRLVVETDGYQFHRGRQAFEDDHTRSLELKARGYEVLQFTYRQVVGEREQIVALLRSLLDASASP